DDHIRIDETEGDHSDNVEETKRLRRLFKDVEDKGSDPDLSGAIYARNDVLDFHKNVGADERGSHELVFRIDNAASGLTTTEGDVITLHLEDGQIVGRVPGGDAAFAIHLHQNGKVSMVQYMSIEHPDTTSSDEHVSLDGKVTAILTVTDEDGDAVSTEIAVGNLLTFDDDGPRVTNQQQDVTVDEDDIDTILSTGTSPDYSNSTGNSEWINFLNGIAVMKGNLQSTVDFGADGDAGAGSFTFANDAAQQLSALGLSSDGDAVQFQHAQVGANLTLMIGVAGGRPVIGLLLNNETGAFEVLQADQLDHVTGNDENTALQLLSGDELAAIDFGSLIIATDGDGDTVTLDGKLDVTVVDDIPAPELWVDDHIRIDETEGPHSDNVPPWVGFDTFKNVTNTGSDTHLSGPIYARNDVLDGSLNVGADEAGNYEVTLEIASDGISSGLYTTEGAEIFLSEENGMIVGRLEGGNGRPEGAAVFAIHVHQNGDVSMVQYMSIKHSDTSSSDEHVSLNGKVIAVLTVTDEDGDEVSTQVQIGEHLTFDDDGPHIYSFGTTGETVELDETAGQQLDELVAAPDSDIRVLFASLDAEALSDPDMETTYARNVNIVEADIYRGADGVDAPEVTLEIAAQGADSGLQTTDGSPINLYAEGDLIVGRAGDGNAAVVFAVSIDEYGSLSVVQYASLKHVQSANDDRLDLAGKISAVLSLTDGDGDTDSASVAIGDKIIFHDDEPNATGAGSKITVSEADDFGVTTSGTLQFEGGSDGAIVTTARIVDDQGYARRFDLEEPQGQRGDFLTVDGEKVVLSSTTDPDGIITIEGTTETGGATAFTVVVQPDGTFEFTQQLGFDHPDVSGAGSDDSIDLRLRFTVTDGDGDTDTATAVISVNDDEVTLTGVSRTATADEDDIVNLNSGVNGNAPGDGDHDGSTTGANDNNGPAYLTDNVSALVDFGNDGGAFEISTDAVARLTQMALTSGGEALSYVVIGDKIVGYVETDGNTDYSFQNDRPVFSLDLTSDNGDVAFKLFDQLDHVAGNGENNIQQPLVIDFGSVIDAVDGDGDSVNLGGKFSIKIVDDVPVIDNSSYEANLVVNGSFEDPDIGSAGHKAIDAMSGWMSTNGTKFELHSNSFSPSSNGKQYLELDKDGVNSGKVDGIYQNIPTEANTQYQLTFDLADRADNSPTSEVRVLWNGVEVGEYSTNSTDWSTITLNVVGTGQSGGDRLEFVELTTPDQNNGLGTYLDDIQLHKVGLVVDEADVTGGNAEVSGSLHINWGTDDADSDVTSPVHGSDRSVSFINVTDGEQAKTVGNIALESAGAPVLLQAFGAVLIGYTGAAPADANDLGNAIFKVTLSDDGSGTYTFELLGQLDHKGDEAEDLSLSFEFEVKDSDGDSVSGDFTVNILDDVPVGAADNVIGIEDVAFDINVLNNDIVGADKDATVLLENAGKTVEGGSVVVNSDGTVKYSPVANFNGQDSFSYRIEDADGDRSEVITVTVDATPVNDRPVLTVTNVQPQFAENGTGPVTEFSAFDVDGDALTYSLTGEDAHLFEIRGNEVYFKVAPDFENPLDVDADQDYNFNIVASDGIEEASEDIEVSVTDQAAELNLFFKPGSSEKFKVKDDFEEHNGSYDYSHSHGNGVVTWSGAWTENGSLDGDSKYGDVYVPQQGGAISGHLYFPHWTPNGEGSISRSVDLTNGENLKLKASVGNRLEFGDDQFDLLIEWDGGSARIPMFDQATQGRSEVITIDISSLPGWNPSEATITFEVSGMEGNDDYARVLNVKITGDIVLDPTTEHDVDFTLGEEGVAIADMLGVDDGDNNAANNHLSSAVITLKNYQQGDTLNYVPQGAYVGISATTAVVGGNLVLTLSGDASYAAYVAAIKAIEFNTSSNIDTRTIEMVVSNGSEESGVATTTINVIENTNNYVGNNIDSSARVHQADGSYEDHARYDFTDQNDHIVGNSAWDNDLFGGLGNDLLVGHHAVRLVNDGLGGQRVASDDFKGGAGYDRMTSGNTEDQDTFIFDVLDGSFDRITDFDGTAQGETDHNVDSLDISALLDKAFGDDEVDAAEAGQYVKIQENGSGSDVLVDTDGAVNGENWSKIAHLDNISNTDTIKVVLDDDGSYSQVDVVA
ncbi:T1SS-143 domain-containing protein, partial [Pseudovibrio ascidiaceicola]